MNVGLEMSESDYVGIVEPDDLGDDEELAVYAPKNDEVAELARQFAREDLRVRLLPEMEGVWLDETQFYEGRFDPNHSS